LKSAFIVDTSALVAIVRGETGHLELLAALTGEAAGLPAPALVEYARVTAFANNIPDPRAAALLQELGITILPFGPEAAGAATVANIDYGSGNGRGGPLNLLDLMVYAIAKVEALPILCTGKDFAATDARLHPASRRD
jgi:ribonuclease VapC